MPHRLTEMEIINLKTAEIKDPENQSETLMRQANLFC